MPDDNDTSQNIQTTFTSPDGVPFRFCIVFNADENSNSLSMKVSREDANEQQSTTRHYHLTNRQHEDYLNLFDKLSKDFGLRVPLNRRPAAPNNFTVTYQVLLRENLVPEMLYGYGDPSVLRVEVAGEAPWYYLAVTSNDAPNAFPILRSKDLSQWEFVTFVFPEGNKPTWAAEGDLVSDYWAPEMHKVGDEYRVYFVARDKHTFELCIGMARSANPYGPFVPDAAPMLRGNMIDPHVLVENEDTVYLFWKEDNNAIWPGLLTRILYQQPGLLPTIFNQYDDQLTASFIVTLWPWIQTLPPMEAFLVKQVFIEAVTADFAAYIEKLNHLSKEQTPALQVEIKALTDAMKTPVFAQQLSKDGSSLVGQKTKIIENDLAWEAHLVEGIWVSKHHGKYYLFYSGNDFSTDQYGIGVAIANSPLGPYTKLPEPFLQSTKEWWAPGHPSLAIGPDGNPQLFLHAFFPGKAGYKVFRALLTVPIILKGIG